MTHKHKIKIKDDVYTDDLPEDTFRSVPAPKPPVQEGTQEGAQIRPVTEAGPVACEPETIPITPVLSAEVSLSRDPNVNRSICTMTEVRYLFSQEVRRMRLAHGYEDVYALSRACGRLNLSDLMKLEVGLFEGFSSIIALARFYEKKVRIVFY